MNQILNFFGAFSTFVLLNPGTLAAETTTLPLFQDVLFYDGYAGRVDFPTSIGVIRHRNDLYARRLSDLELQSIGRDLTLNVTIKAACDNYDRIGNFNLAFVPKGEPTYSPADVPRIEVGRFITPFMSKNIQPDRIQYTFKVDNVARILKDEKTLADYDIWAELEVFGVPYAANTQVDGCKDRNDVFYGSAEFVTSSEAVDSGNNFFLPLNFKKDLNNYTAGATDELTKTVRTIPFQLAQDLSDARFYLITSNHGANAGGEEYNRRVHNIYFDDKLIASYTPGGVSCEPYRIYNTQPNGIYGRTPRTPEQWASFSNWCPGQVIPIRDLELGQVSAGEHSFKITVPDAVFIDAQGYIPVSVYLQGRAER